LQSRMPPFSIAVALLATAVLLGAVLLAVAFLPTGSPHPENPMWALGTAAGVLMVGVMGFLGVIGVRRHGRLGTPGRWVASGFAVYGLVFVALMVSYRAYVTQGSTDLVFGVPTPTLWLLLGIWQLPWVLVGLLVYNYRRWTLSPDDQARFDERVRVRRSGNTSRRKL